MHAFSYYPLLYMLMLPLSSARLHTSLSVGITSSNLSCTLPCMQHMAGYKVSVPYIVLEWTDLLLISKIIAI